MRSEIAKTLHGGKGALVLTILLVALLVLAISSRDFAGRLVPRQRLWLGVEVLPVTDTIRSQFRVYKRGGVIVDTVYDLSPAHGAGLRRGDVILNVANHPIADPLDIALALHDRKVEEKVNVVYLRDNVVYATAATLEHRSLVASAPHARSVYHYHLTTADFFAFLCLGILVDTLAAFVGSGGGVLKVSLLLLLFGIDIFLAKVVSILSSGFMGLSASRQYIKTKQVDWKCQKFMVPASIIGAVCGVGVCMIVGRHFLESLLAFFLIFVGLSCIAQLVWNAQGKASDDEIPSDRPFEPDRPRWLLVFAGFPAGVFSTVLGITGGIVGEPLHRILLKAPMRTCIANTMITVVFDAFLGGGLLLLIDGMMRDRFSFWTFLQIWVIVAHGSLIGGQLGALLNGVMPTKVVKGVYAAVVLLIAAKLLFAM